MGFIGLFIGFCAKFHILRKKFTPVNPSLYHTLCIFTKDATQLMPTSNSVILDTVISAARRCQPRSILDVGVGFGKFGVLFREFIDIRAAEEKPEDYARKNWSTRLEGIEVSPQYLTPLHAFIYDQVHTGDAREVIDGLGQYDLIWCGNVIEHFEKEEAWRLVEKLWQHTERVLMIATPYAEAPQGSSFGNPHECHLSSWTEADWRDIPGVSLWRIGGRQLIAFRSRDPQRWKARGLATQVVEYRKKLFGFEFWRRK